jgi:hypothetical protein
MSKIVKHSGGIDRHLRKQEIVELAHQHAQLAGVQDPQDLLRTYIELKRYEIYLKHLLPHLKLHALETASNWNRLSLEWLEGNLKLVQRARWDFSVDETWNQLNEQIEQLSQLRQNREQYLKECSEAPVVVDEETGEVVDAFEIPREIEYNIALGL